jgi:hypothetical protein
LSLAETLVGRAGQRECLTVFLVSHKDRDNVIAALTTVVRWRRRLVPADLRRINMQGDTLQKYARDRVEELPHAKCPVDPETFGRRDQ